MTSHPPAHDVSPSSGPSPHAPLAKHFTPVYPGECNITPLQTRHLTTHPKVQPSKRGPRKMPNLNPSPISTLTLPPNAGELWSDEELEPAVSLDGVVTVVDAANVARQLAERRAGGVPNEAQLQVALADVVLVNKVGGGGRGQEGVGWCQVVL